MLPNQRWESVRRLKITNWSKVSNFGQTHLSDWHRQRNSNVCRDIFYASSNNSTSQDKSQNESANIELVGFAILECPVWSHLSHIPIFNSDANQYKDVGDDEEDDDDDGDGSTHTDEEEWRRWR